MLKQIFFSAGGGLRVCVCCGWGGRPTDPYGTRLRSRVRNKHSEIKEMRISGRPY